MAEKIVAIVGRPNVGKSSLFNRLIGKKVAIVHETAGVTRDRHYGQVEWNGQKFFLIDTGGYIVGSKDKIDAAIREQVEISMSDADIILFVVDAQSGITTLDYEIAKILRKETGIKKNENKKVILAVNKVDSKKEENILPEFYSLGLGEVHDVSAMVGRKSGDLLDIITSNIQPDDSDAPDDSAIRFAIIGRPNVGKSSIMNILTNSNRHIVTDIPGTTRDSIDTRIKHGDDEIVLIDTAGLRKKSKIRRAESLEFYSALRTHRSIERCDVAIIVVDATTIVEKLKKSSDPEDAVFKLDKEDVEILSEAAKLKKGILIVINKWDLVEKDSNTTKLFEKKINEHLKSYQYLPFIFTSAITKQRVMKIMDDALEVYRERAKEIKTSVLNEKLNKIIKETPPHSKTHKELKINYITQLKHSPPVIAFFANHPQEIEENYKRFLEGKIREFFKFTGVPLTLIFKPKNKKED